MIDRRPAGRGLLDRLRSNPFAGYAYSYPHKHAYRQLPEPVPLELAWRSEDKNNLYLYVHLPFCEMRCGFCNLFTTTHPSESLTSAYLDALAREVDQAAAYLGDHRFARGAVGGGTPTFLELAELDFLFGVLHDRLGGMAPGTPFSLEVSPATVSEEKLALALERGVTRVSIGVQTFVESEVKHLGRHQDPVQLERALGMIRDAGFPVFNLDLIYGIDTQDDKSWRESLRRALEHRPEELYLYPLYVRPLTGLGRRETPPVPSDNRLGLYRTGRDLLLEEGYEQISMRLFRRRPGRAESSTACEGPVYCCQEDGMVGLGSGARSYTRELHYSTEYAVGREGVNAIIGEYVGRSPADHRNAVFGYRLDGPEQMRRYLIKSLLRLPGLETDDYRRVFGRDPASDFPELDALIDCGLAAHTGGTILLRPEGLELSDAIGPWLVSADVIAAVGEYCPR